MISSITNAAQTRSRWLSVLCCLDLITTRPQEHLLQGYARLGSLLREEGLTAEPALPPQNGCAPGRQGRSSLYEQAAELFCLFKQQPVQWEDVVRCSGDLAAVYSLEELSAELALGSADIAVQQQVCAYNAERLRSLPPLIGVSAAAVAELDPNLITLYEQAVTLDLLALTDIFPTQDELEDACITLDKLSFAKYGAVSRSASVLIHPLLPGQAGSLVASPSLLFDSILFRLSLLYAVGQRAVWE